MSKESGYLHTRADNWGKMPEELMHDKTITDGAKVLYTHMHWRYGSNCRNFEGQQSMADFMDVSPETIGDRVDELVQNDWIVTVERRTRYGRRPNFYHVFEIQNDCVTWRRDHNLPKPPPKVDKNGKTAKRKPRAHVGGKPTHKNEPTRTQVELCQSELEYGASSNQLHSSQPHSLNSFEAKASHELAGTPSEDQIRANLPHLNKDERDAMKHLLLAVQNGKVVESVYSAKVVRYLLELGEIERCKFGVYSGLCLKAKSAPEPLTGESALPEHVNRADEKNDPEPTQDELLTNLRTSLQEAQNGQTHPIAELWNEDDPPRETTTSPALFLQDLPPTPPSYDAGFSGAYGVVFTRHYVTHGQTTALCGATNLRHSSSDLMGTPIQDCANCRGHLDGSSPRETPAPPALPEVPTFKPGDFVWWIPAEVQHNPCGTQPRIAAVVISLSDKRVHILSDRDNCNVKPENLRPREKPDTLQEWELQALRTIYPPLSAAPKAPRKAKAERDPLFKAVATGIMGYAPENGTLYTKGQCQLINSVKGAIMRVMALQKTDADYQKGADGIPLYKVFFKGKHPNLDYPTHASFEGYFKEWFDAEGGKGGKLPQGDFSEPVWIDRLFVKRENGILYCRPTVGEWREAVPSEVAKWE